MHNTPRARRGRGAQSNTSGRFEPMQRIDFNDGWQSDITEEPSLRTLWREDRAKTINTRNQSPDIHFNRSINSYRGANTGASIALPDRRTPSSVTPRAWISNGCCM